MDPSMFAQLAYLTNNMGENKNKPKSLRTIEDSK